MHFSKLAIISFNAALATACTQCVHPGNFTGGLSTYWNPTSICTVTLPNIAASIPASFWAIRDESPCGMEITVTSPITGATVIATVVSKEADAVGDSILLTISGMGALAPDDDPNHAPGTVHWTFNN